MTFLKPSLLAAAMALGTATVALAEYPERPVTLIVPYAPGGATDLQARLLVPFVEKRLGTTIVVENRGGAGTIIGSTAVANSKKDGYTLGKLVFPTSYGHIVTKDATYTLDSFTLLANQWVGRNCICVPANSPFKTLDDFIAAAKTKTLNVGVVSLSSAATFGSRLFQSVAGIKATHVPFEGGAAVTTAILGGHIDAGAMPVAEVLEQFKAGKIRALAILSDTRWDEMKDVPTAVELGHAASFDSNGGFVAPSGLPDNVRAKLVSAFEGALQDPDYLAVAKKNSVQTLYLSNAQFNKQLPELYGKLKTLIEADMAAKK